LLPQWLDCDFGGDSVKLERGKNKENPIDLSEAALVAEAWQTGVND